MARARRSDESAAPARSDAYVGLLLISLLAQIAAVIFFYLDWSTYESTKPRMPSPPTLSSTSPAGGNPPAGGGPGGGPAGVPAGGGPGGGPAGVPAGGGPGGMPAGGGPAGMPKE